MVFYVILSECTSGVSTTREGDRSVVMLNTSRLFKGLKLKLGLGINVCTTKNLFLLMEAWIETKSSATSFGALQHYQKKSGRFIKTHMTSRIQEFHFTTSKLY